MRRLAIVLSLFLLAAVPAAADAKVRKGPSGLKFYSPPHSLVAGKPGSLIWARKLSGTPALHGGAGNRLILYRSTGVTGKTAVVSGTVSIPKGKAPKGGWPVISYAHGTTGIADQCAPSRDTPSNGAHGLTAYAYPLLQRWLKAGYAVVRTDYEGLGTPGDHPYLNGRTEGAAVLDAARAARKLDTRLGKRLVIAGHSQGGQAALWAASLAHKLTPELKLRGTLALAPVSHLAEQSGSLGALTSPSPLSGLVAMILRGVDIAAPQAGVPALLGDAAAPLYPQTLTECLDKLASTSSFGAIAPADLIRQGADNAPLVAQLGKLDDPEDLRIRTSVQVQQGVADQTVFKVFTDQLVDEYKKRGNPVTYKTFEGVDHGGAVTSAKSADAATKYIRARFK
jgi:pimeloyl-ACP methyl ester carboxylesterase